MAWSYLSFRIDFPNYSQLFQVYLFGEILVEDEYNPTAPTDYEEHKKKLDERRAKEKIAKEIAERLHKFVSSLTGLRSLLVCSSLNELLNSENTWKKKRRGRQVLQLLLHKRW